MPSTKESDQEGACDPLLIEEGDCEVESETCHGIVRKNRSNEATSYLIPSTNLFNNKKRLIIFVVLILVLICLNSSAIIWDERGVNRPMVQHRSNVPGMKGYLVWSDKCKMPNIDPFGKDIMTYIKRQKYEPCSSKEPLTRIEFNSTTKIYILKFEKNLVKSYASSGTLDCCYQNVERSGKDSKADSQFKTGKCKSISKSEVLDPKLEFILVKCTSNKKKVYTNAHAILPERADIRKRLNDWKSKTNVRPLSVLLIGIDSVSKQNFVRSMPNTAQHVFENEWFEMSGYNKIDDNTFPNLMAMFAGYNRTTTLDKCNPKQVGRLDNCSLLWYEFQRCGYVTAYAEDEQSISTFNYLKKGFIKPPTDYYLRPFLMAAENALPTKLKSGLTFCLGFKHSAEYVYDYAVDLATTYKNDPYFGLFWTNTFSHNAINDVSSMDSKMVEYLQKFEKIGALNNSVVIFFSDHGIRFGPTRRLASGRIEERHPFLFIWLPPWFKNENPEFVNALNVNKNRLTTPYDVHMTLKHILELSGRKKNLPGAADCPNGQTLLEPVPHSRSCKDVAIEDHWCTCVPYEAANKKSKIVKHVTELTVDYINDFLNTFENGSLANLCAKLRLSDIKHVHVASVPSFFENSTATGYQLAFETKPGNGLFEATIHYETPSSFFEVTGTISRLDSYSSQSHCVSDGAAKKYCYCKNNKKG